MTFLLFFLGIMLLALTFATQLRLCGHVLFSHWICVFIWVCLKYSKRRNTKFCELMVTLVAGGRCGSIRTHTQPVDIKNDRQSCFTLTVLHSKTLFYYVSPSAFTYYKTATSLHIQNAGKSEREKT